MSDSDNSVLGIISRDLVDVKTKLTEISHELRNVESQSNRTSSHLESELGNINRRFIDVQRNIEKISSFIHGSDTRPGLDVRLDRLEQNESRRIGQLKYVWSIIATIIASILALFAQKLF